MEAADGALLTEYRGLTVAELAELRRELTAAGGDYKVYKNTLVRLAVADTEHAGMSDLLTGPTAIAFVQGDVSAVAKALRDFAQANPALIVKGGVVGSTVMSAAEIEILADLPSRDTLLAQLPAPCRPRSSSSPAWSRPCPAAWRTGSRHSSSSAGSEGHRQMPRPRLRHRQRLRPTRLLADAPADEAPAEATAAE